MTLKIGTTSYIVPGDLVANARHLAGRADHMQLVLFDVPGGPCNFPTPAEARALRMIGDSSGLSYIVHLPLDLHLGPVDDPFGHPSLAKARAVIDVTRDLLPVAYVAHLDGREVLAAPTDAAGYRRWCAETGRAVAQVCDWIGDPALLAIENLEGYPLDVADPILSALPVSRCLDIGHLWVDGHDPLPVLAAALERTRVIHLHGLAARDHSSLVHTPPERLDAVVSALLAADFDGWLTLEVFEADYETSLTALHASLERCLTCGSLGQADVSSITDPLTPGA